MNLALLAALGFTVFRFLSRRSWERAERGVIALGDLLNDTHAAINVCLFPPLFFFSALYYTDIASTLMVLLFLDELFAHPTNGVRFSWRQMLYAVAALLMRQTNVFWVAIFPAAIDVITVIKTEKVWKTPEDKAASIYDRTVEDAAFEGTVTMTSWVSRAKLHRLSTIADLCCQRHSTELQPCDYCRAAACYSLDCLWGVPGMERRRSPRQAADIHRGAYRLMMCR